MAIAATSGSIVYDIIVGKDTLSPYVMNYRKRLVELGKLQAQGFDMTPQITQMRELGVQSGISTKVIKQGLTEGTRAASAFDARLLSLLFGGMALQRAFGGMLRSITATFIKAQDNTSGLGQATTRLHAAWEFLKFSIFDALDTPFFMRMIDGIISAINWFSELPRGAKIAFLIITSGLALIGTALMIIGQVRLGWASIFGVGGFTAGMGKLLSFSGLLGIGLILLIISALIIGVAGDFESFKETATIVAETVIASFRGIKSSLDSVAQAIGFEDALQAVGMIGIATFGVIALAINNAALALNLFINSLVFMGKIFHAFFFTPVEDFHSTFSTIFKDIDEFNERFDKLAKGSNKDIIESTNLGLARLKGLPTEIGTVGFEEFPVGREEQVATILNMTNALQDYGEQSDKSIPSIMSLSKTTDENLNPALADTGDLYKQIKNSIDNVSESEEANQIVMNNTIVKQEEERTSINDTAEAWDTLTEAIIRYKNAKSEGDAEEVTDSTV